MASTVAEDEQLIELTVLSAHINLDDRQNNSRSMHIPPMCLNMAQLHSHGAALDCDERASEAKNKEKKVERIVA